MTLLEIEGCAIDPRHFIAGAPISDASARTFPVFSPIDGRNLGELPAGGPAEIDRAVAAARAAFPAWAALGPAGRGQLLARFAQAILEHRLQLSAVESVDNGSLLIGNQKHSVDRAAHNISYFAEYARTLAPAPLRSPEVDNHVRYEPAGVAALLTPWNAPLLLSTWKLGPALAAGNTVVLKPPEWAPLSCAMLVQLAAAAGIPAGVFNLVHGLGAEAGQALVEHPDVDRISFTGSTATGRRVAAAAASNLTPISLELGGKSPFLVFADADLDAAATNVAAQFNNAGQVCLAGTRVLVEASVEREFRARVLEAARAYTVGDPRQKGVRVGPLIHPRQLERVSGFVSRALADGARPLLGGGPHALGGLYYQPTILSEVKADAEIIHNEVFGPVLTWQTFESEREAIQLANATDYGLAAMLFSRDAARVERVAAAIVAGTVWVNCYFVRELGAPFGGARQSGIGREGGSWSFDFFCDVKNVAIKRDSLQPTAAEAKRG
jgi:acyl-CoA reductase-like NAD-dependent aldehyde dehydrogenase